MRKAMFAIVVAVVCLSSFQKTFAQDKNSWTYNNNSTINWYEKTSFGPIIIATDKCLAAVDPKTQTTLWELANYPKLDTISVIVKKNLPFIKIAIHDTAVVDTTTTVKRKAVFLVTLENY